MFLIFVLIPTTTKKLKKSVWFGIPLYNWNFIFVFYFWNSNQESWNTKLNCVVCLFTCCLICMLFIWEPRFISYVFHLRRLGIFEMLLCFLVFFMIFQAYIKYNNLFSVVLLCLSCSCFISISFFKYLRFCCWVCFCMKKNNDIINL